MLFFEAQYLARAEDPRRGALFLIDPSMIVVQYPMTRDQQQEFQTFGGKKVLYFDVLDTPNLQERKEEIRRCRMRGDEQRRKYEEADRKWEAEMQERLTRRVKEEAEKPKLSKKAKQKQRQAEKKGSRNGQNAGSSEDTCEAQAEAEEERLHKMKQAESRAKAEESLRQEREQEVARKKLEAAEAKRQAEVEAARMHRIKTLLQKVQSSLRPEQDALHFQAEIDATSEESSEDGMVSPRNPNNRALMT